MSINSIRRTPLTYSKKRSRKSNGLTAGDPVLQNGPTTKLLANSKEDHDPFEFPDDSDQETPIIPVRQKSARVNAEKRRRVATDQKAIETEEHAKPRSSRKSYSEGDAINVSMTKKAGDKKTKEKDIKAAETEHIFNDFYRPSTPVNASLDSPKSARQTHKTVPQQKELWDFLDQAIGNTSSPRRPHNGNVESTSRVKLINQLSKSNARSINKYEEDREEDVGRDSDKSDEDEEEEQETVRRRLFANSELAPSQENEPVRRPIRPASITKLTYGIQRTFLDENPVADLLDAPLPGTKPSLSLEKDEEFEDDSIDNIKVKSIHELRESGNNARFIDEMEYLLDGLENGSGPPSKRAT